MQSLPDLVKELSRTRGTSIVILEITTTSTTILCEDVSSLRAEYGKRRIARAVVAALENMLAFARVELGEFL